MKLSYYKKNTEKQTAATWYVVQGLSIKKSHLFISINNNTQQILRQSRCTSSQQRIFHVVNIKRREDIKFYPKCRVRHKKWNKRQHFKLNKWFGLDLNEYVCPASCCRKEKSRSSDRERFWEGRRRLKALNLYMWKLRSCCLFVTINIGQSSVV